MGSVPSSGKIRQMRIWILASVLISLTLSIPASEADNYPNLTAELHSLSDYKMTRSCWLRASIQ